ncbi:hypothetical protein ACFXC2_41705, partial [Streptomyces lavendulae]
MTEYGRGRAPEPWHPEDPLYGDQGWTGQATQQGQVPYAGGQQQYPQEPQYQEPQYQQYPQQYPEQYQEQQYPQQQYVPQDQQLQHQLHPQHQQLHPQPQPQPVYDGQGWDTGQGQQLQEQAQYQAAPVDPYAGAEPYAQQVAAGYQGEAPDLYTTPEAFPPPQPPGRGDRLRQGLRTARTRRRGLPHRNEVAVHP